AESCGRAVSHLWQSRYNPENYRYRGGGSISRSLPPLSSYAVPQAEQTACPASRRSRSPQRQIHPTRRAGTPTTSANAGTSAVTTAPAPTKQYSPRECPHTMVALAPIDAPRPTGVGRYSCLRETWLRGFETLVKTQLG